MEPDYSNREISEMFHSVKDIVNRIEQQTIKTNGRVGELEKWRFISMGSIAVLVVLVVPLLAWAMYVLSEIDNKIHESVDEALTAYEVDYENNQETDPTVTKTAH